MSMLKFSVYLLVLACASSYAQNVDLDNYQSLVSDVKSYSLGEPVIVIVVESTTAEAAAGTGVEKNTGISAGFNENDDAKSVGMSVDANNQGEGKTSRRGRMTTQLSATIIEVMPNSMLKIKGTQDLTINGEKQRIVVSGIIRASDISKNNSIFSYQIANVELEVAGDGSISAAQKQNIIFRFFNWLGLL
jgi:flagellar L-ring protein FlgH